MKKLCVNPEKKQNKLEKSNEKKITDEEVADTKSKRDMPRRTNVGLDTEFEDCVFQTDKKLDQVAFLISKACLKNKRKPV